MAMTYQNVRLDMKPQRNPPHVDVTQYDSGTDGWVLNVYLFKDGETFVIPSGYTAKLEGTTKRNTGFTIDATNIANNSGVVSFELTEDATAFKGSAWSKIVFRSGTSQISTSGFWLDCDRAGVEAETVIGADGFENILRNQFEAYIEEHGSATPGSGVDSVNGKSGVVVLDMEDVGVEEDATLQPYYARRANEVVAVARSYYDNRADGQGNPRFRYGQQNTYRTTPFVLGNIDCSAFIGLVLRGIPYGSSPYGEYYNAGNSIGDEITFDPDSVRCNPALSWPVDPRSYVSVTYTKDETDGDPAGGAVDVTDSTTSKTVVPTAAANLAQMLCSVGDIVPLTDDFRYVQPGDIIFWAEKKSNGNWIQPNRFLRISHVAVCTGAENGTHTYLEVTSYDDYNYNQSAEDGFTVHQDTIENSLYHPASGIVMVGRLKYGNVWTPFKVIAQPVDTTASAEQYVQFHCLAKGDGVTYQWQFRADENSDWIDASGVNGQRSGYITSADASRNGRQHRCIVYDAHGQQLISETATLTVT